MFLVRVYCSFRGYPCIIIITQVEIAIKTMLLIAIMSGEIYCPAKFVIVTGLRGKILFIENVDAFIQINTVL